MADVYRAMRDGTLMRCVVSATDVVIETTESGSSSLRLLMPDWVFQYLPPRVQRHVASQLEFRMMHEAARGPLLRRDPGDIE